MTPKMISTKTMVCKYLYLRIASLILILGWGRGNDYDDLEDEQSRELVWAILASYLPTGKYAQTLLLKFYRTDFILDERALQKLFVQHAEYSLAHTRSTIKDNPKSCYKALALSYGFITVIYLMDI